MFACGNHCSVTIIIIIIGIYSYYQTFLAGEEKYERFKEWSKPAIQKKSNGTQPLLAAVMRTRTAEPQPLVAVVLFEKMRHGICAVMF